jgi:hypothetical protein
VLIYEMVAGYPPFYQEDRVAMFRAICSTEFKMPQNFSKVRVCYLLCKCCCLWCSAGRESPERWQPLARVQAELSTNRGERQ